MPIRRRLFVRLTLSIVTLAMVWSASVAGSVEHSDPPGPAEPPLTGNSGPGSAVTLVTGDRIMLSGRQDDRPAVQIQPAQWPDRQVAFHSWQSGSDLYVVPSDVARLVPRILDLSLFNVTALVNAGLDDTGSPALPLLVQHDSDVAMVLESPLRASVTLQSFPATAAELDKSAATTVGAELAAAHQALAAGAPEPFSGGIFAGAERLLLDHPVQAALDHSLPQIGAPAAWDQGYSGAGVRVAVLDTGIDTDHPDLSGSVVASANFTDSSTVDDRNGHGTHVAGIIAGRGRAGDSHPGVAFDAQLLNAKVLDDAGGGTASTIIAGMEWAVAQRADVVNLSISSAQASAGDDPVSQALDTLSAESDVLFVVAAGNSGPLPRTVGSPGAAAQALTVGAVDSNDEIADFSSRGPRQGDWGLKPDLTAPGVEIVSARAGDTSLGTPVDDWRTRASGTSMAAPHVAGAVAVLTGARPDWTAAQRKAALVATTDPIAGANPYEYGSGRVNLARAIEQVIAVDQGSVDFATVPCDVPPEHRTITLTNTGTGPATVNAELTLLGPAGGTAPAGLATVSPSQLRLPAGDTGTVTVTLTPAVTGAGEYQGELALTPSDGPAFRLPVAAFVAPVSATVSISAVDRNGAPYREGWVHLVNVDDVLRSPVQHTGAPGLILLDQDGKATVEVPVGTYSAIAFVDTIDGMVLQSKSVVGSTEITIDDDFSLVFDAATAQPAQLTVEGIDDLSVNEFQVGYHRTDAQGESLFYEFSAPGWGMAENPVFVEPSAPVQLGEVETRMFWRVSGTDATGPAEVSLPFVGSGFLDPPVYRVSASELAQFAQVETGYRALGPQPLDYRVVQGWLTPRKSLGIGVAQAVLAEVPATRTEYFRPDPNLTWYQCILVITPQGELLEQRCDAAFSTRHLPGERSQKWWLAGPFDPTLGVVRTRDRLALDHISPLADGSDRTHTVDTVGVRHQMARIWRDGTLVHEGAPPPAIAVPADRAATIRIERGLELDPEVTQLPSSTQVSWTFTTTPPTGAGSVVPPVLVADVRADVDSHNRVAPRQALPLLIDIHQLREAKPAPISSAELWVSADRGQHWESLPLTAAAGDYRTEVPADLLTPGGSLSIRLNAHDANGSSVEQTVLDALGVAGS